MFFFKQKPAYERRISDWSSTCALPIFPDVDVVESALDLELGHGRPRLPTTVGSLRSMATRVLNPPPPPGRRRPRTPTGRARLAHEILAETYPIGRAACGGRVSSYFEISGYT